MKKALAFTLIGTVPVFGFSQQFTGYNYDNYAGVPGMVQNPAMLPGNKYKVNVNLFSVSGLAGNNAYEVKKSKLFHFDFSDMTEDVDYFKSANTDKKNLWINTDVLGPSVMVTINPKNGIGFYTRARTLVNEFNLSDRSLRFFNSNDGFYNTNIQEENLQMKAHAFGEAGLSYGYTVYQDPQQQIKVGITGKYIVGIGAAAAYSKSILVNIAPSDIINQLAGDVTVRYSSNLDDAGNSDVKDYFDRESGNNGWGFDLGVVYEWKPLNATTGADNDWFSADQTPYKLRLSASVTDIGSVKYKNSQHGNSYVLNGTGHPTRELEQGDDETIEEYFSRLESIGIITTQAHQNTLKVKLPAAIRFDADWHVYKRFFVNAGTVVNMIGKNNNEFTAHYTTSFTITPRLEKKWFSVYSPVYYNLQHKKIAWGIGFRAGPLFAGSASVLSNLIGNSNISATDFHAGLSVPIFQRKKVKKEVPPVVERIVDTVEKKVEVVKEVTNDRDFDGVVDEKDACPDVFGEVELLGCPDKDKDGIADIFDKCPDTPGVKKYNGCPIPDFDGDGINDDEDKCPSIAGKRELNGCPEVKQEVVKKVNMAAKSTYFMTGKDIIQKVSYPKLDTIVSVLQSDPDLHISIEGHTDNVGSAAVNETLSNKRAQAVKNYLVKKGVAESRITAMGFGSSRPVAPNSTPAGRARNRRVELHLSY
jgi:outer membrane protein OmpA-like peptidoglycan-associated protein